MLMFFTAYRSASPCLLPYAIGSSPNSAQTEALSFNFELNQTQTEPPISELITNRTGTDDSESSHSPTGEYCLPLTCTLPTRHTCHRQASCRQTVNSDLLILASCSLDGLQRRKCFFFLNPLKFCGLGLVGNAVLPTRTQCLTDDSVDKCSSRYTKFVVGRAQ